MKKLTILSLLVITIGITATAQCETLLKKSLNEKKSVAPMTLSDTVKCLLSFIKKHDKQFIGVTGQINSLRSDLNDLTGTVATNEDSSFARASEARAMIGGLKTANDTTSVRLETNIGRFNSSLGTILDNMVSSTTFWITFGIFAILIGILFLLHYSKKKGSQSIKEKTKSTTTTVPPGDSANNAGAGKQEF